MNDFKGGFERTQTIFVCRNFKRLFAINPNLKHKRTKFANVLQISRMMRRKKKILLQTKVA